MGSGLIGLIKRARICGKWMKTVHYMRNRVCNLFIHLLSSVNEYFI